MNKGTNDSTSWEVLIPGSFFVASAICYVDPSLAPSLLFALLAFGTVFISPMVAFFTKPATEGLTGTVTDAINTITDDRYSEQREKFFDAIALLISKSIQSNALKAAITESLMDEDLQDATLNTVQMALIKASENEDFRKSSLNIVRLAFVQALNDEEFVRDLMSSIVGALVQASKEEELTTSILDVVTCAVSQALADEKFVNEIRGAVKDTLQDGDIYKAGAKGMISAAFGGATEFQKSFMRKDQNQLA